MGNALEDLVSPSPEEAELARESSRQLSPYARGKLRITISAPGQKDEKVDLPAPAVQALVRILTEMASGNAVTLIPVRAELTTQEAAELLNVSRPFLCNKLLDAGKIKFHKVGTHRRILFRDLMEYKRRSDEARERAMAELAADAQEQGLGY